MNGLGLSNIGTYAGSLLASATLTDASIQAVANSTLTPAEVSSTLRCTFTVPASGKVLLISTSTAAGHASAACILGFGEVVAGTPSLIAGSERACSQQSTQYRETTHAYLWTGLTPGESKIVTVMLRTGADTNSVSYGYGSTRGQGILRVEAA